MTSDKEKVSFRCTYQMTPIPNHFLNQTVNERLIRFLFQKCLKTIMVQQLFEALR